MNIRVNRSSLNKKQTQVGLQTTNEAQNIQTRSRVSIFETYVPIQVLKFQNSKLQYSMFQYNEGKVSIHQEIIDTQGHMPIHGISVSILHQK